MFDFREFSVAISSAAHLEICEADTAMHDKLFLFDVNVGRRWARFGRNLKALEKLRSLLSTLVTLAALDELLEFLLLLGGLPQNLLPSIRGFFGVALPDPETCGYDEISDSDLTSPHLLGALRVPVAKAVVDERFSTIFSQIKDQPLLLHTFRSCVINRQLRVSLARLARFDPSKRFENGNWAEYDNSDKILQANRSIQDQLHRRMASIPECAWPMLAKVYKSIEIISFEDVTAAVEEYGHQHKVSLRCTVRLSDPKDDFQFHMENSYGIWGFEEHVLLCRPSARARERLGLDDRWVAIDVPKTKQKGKVATGADAQTKTPTDPFLTYVASSFGGSLEEIAGAMLIISHSTTFDV